MCPLIIPTPTPQLLPHSCHLGFSFDGSTVVQQDFGNPYVSVPCSTVQWRQLVLRQSGTRTIWNSVLQVEGKKNLLANDCCILIATAIPFLSYDPFRTVSLHLSPHPTLRDRERDRQTQWLSCSSGSPWSESCVCHDQIRRPQGSCYLSAAAPTICNMEIIIMTYTAELLKGQQNNVCAFLWKLESVL